MSLPSYLDIPLEQFNQEKYEHEKEGKGNKLYRGNGRGRNNLHLSDVLDGDHRLYGNEESHDEAPKNIVQTVLEIKEKPREKCPNPSMFNHPATSRWVLVPCNQWKCPVCCRRKAWKLKKRIERAIKQRDVRHLTLTIPDNSYNIMGMFNNLRTQLRKRGKCNAYFWVKEFQERGVRHLHVILFEYIHFTEIKTYWEGNIKIKLVKGNASYLTKYLTKVEEQHLFDKGERRYSSSRDFFEHLPEVEKESGWEYWGNRDLLEMFGVDTFDDVVKMIQNYGSSIEVR